LFFIRFSAVTLETFNSNNLLTNSACSLENIFTSSFGPGRYSPVRLLMLFIFALLISSLALSPGQ